MSLSTAKRSRPTSSRLGPVQRLPGASEAAIQADCLELLRVGYPDVFVFHIANGGMIMEPRVVAKLKWQGLRPGVPDLALYWTGGHALVEVKSAVGRLSDDQKAVHELLRMRGHKVGIVRSTDDLRAALAEWKVPCRLTT